MTRFFGSLRNRAFMAGIVALIALGASEASAQFKDPGNATDVINPYSPRYGNPYRRGVVPTMEVHQRMRSWAASTRPDHRSVITGKAYGQTAAHLAAAAASGSRTLAYNGGIDGIGVTSGPPKVYLVFWGTQWGPASSVNGNVVFPTSGDPKGAAPYMQNWIRGLGTNNELWSGVMTQYCDGAALPAGVTSCPAGAQHVGYPAGGVLAGVWVDNSAASPAKATGNQIAQEAVRAAAHFGNTSPASNRYAQYIIMSPTGTRPDGFPSAGFCGWHSYNGDTSLSGGGAAPSTYGDIAFTNMPYVTDAGTSCGQNFVSTTLDGFSLVGGHEYAETLTDQNGGGGWYNISGSTYNGQENGDECAWIRTGQGASALVAFSTGLFAMQSTWSNDTNRCDISHPIVTGNGGVPAANFSFQTTGLSVAFTDASTDAGGSIGAYSWTFGDGATSASASPAHVYAAAGTYDVVETVTDSVNGTKSSKTVSVSVTVTGGTPLANFTYLASGLSVVFTDASVDTGGSISTYAWSFGDGTSATIASPTHVFASAGSYQVTETVTDRTNGKTSSKILAVSVAATSGSSNLLVNGGFEAGSNPAPWVVTAGVLCNASICPGETPHAGIWFAWLDGYGASHVDTVDQTVSIPAGKTSASLTFFIHIDTQETGPTAYDTLQVQVLNTTGTVLGTLATFSNANAAPGFASKTLSMTPYIGKTVKIRFLGVEDSTLATSFIIDDISLLVQ